MVAVAAGLRARHWRHVMTARVHKHHIWGGKFLLKSPENASPFCPPLAERQAARIPGHNLS